LKWMHSHVFRGEAVLGEVALSASLYLLNRASTF
jgi:hypothetical protein